MTYWSKRKNTAFVGSLIYPSGGQTQVDPWAVKEITQQADLHAATDAKKKKGGHLAHHGHIKENLVINGQGEPWRLHYHHIHLAVLIYNQQRTHSDRNARQREHTPWPHKQDKLPSHNNQEMLLPLTIN